MPALNQLGSKQYDATSTYGDRLHIVHLYVVEPRPESPDLSPYTGTAWPPPSYGTRPQALTYDKRVSAANDITPELGDKHLILVDTLAPDGLNNPAWCTYGPCPNCAYLIGQDGMIHATQTWFEADGMRVAIDRLLSGNE